MPPNSNLMRCHGSRNNLPKNSIIVVDNFFIAELREDGFKYVQEGWFVNNASLNGNALNIDYFICSNLSVVDTPYTHDAVLNCVPIESFSSNVSALVTTIIIYKVIK